jgi:hypothetical protein
VRGNDFDAVFAKRHEFILEDEPDLVIGSMQIRMRPSFAYYYRGIRVAKTDAPALFTYNDMEEIVLTEDRTMKHESYMRIHVAAAVLESSDKGFIKSCVLAKDCFEEHLDFDSWRLPSAEFLTTVGDLVGDKMCQINQTAYKAWKKHSRKNINPTEIVLTKVQAIMFENALNFVDGIGFKVRGAYPVKFVESLGEGVFGLAKDDTIYIVERVLHQGTKALASTLIEEYIHLKHGYKDNTYEMQTYLFDKIISLGEELKGEPL